MIREIRISDDHIIHISFALKAMADLGAKYPDINWRKYNPLSDNNLSRMVEYYTLCINHAASKRQGQPMTMSELYDLMETNPALLEDLEAGYLESRGIPAKPFKEYQQELETLVREYELRAAAGADREAISADFEKRLAELNAKYTPSLGRLGEELGKNL